MHYYKFHIGDYARDASHLSVVEHGIYRLLLDWCYLNEKPITTERAMRVGRGYPEETQSVLSEFFSQTEEGWVHSRVASEVVAYHAKSKKNRENGAKGGRKPSEKNPVGFQSASESNPNHKPLTNNHIGTPPQAAPPTPDASRGSRLPADWVLPEQWRAWAENERPDLQVEFVADSFRDFWISKPGKDGRKSDWQATWRNWVRSQKAGQGVARPTQNPLIAGAI